MKYNPYYQNTKTEKHKPKKAPQEGVANKYSAADQASSVANEGTAQKTLSGYEGPITDSPYYKSMLATSTDSTTNAYNNAKATSAARANAAGFGNTQPATQGANAEINAQETAALAKLPSQAIEATAPLQLEAASRTAQLGETQGAQATQNNATAGQLDMQYQQMQQAFQNSLLNAGVGAATNIFAPGLGKAFSNSIGV